jgi:PHP family Zn ribbon phosphoesterase
LPIAAVYSFLHIKKYIQGGIMKQKSRRYFIKVTNPNKGTMHLVKQLHQEFKADLEQYWQKRDDPEIILHTSPVYLRNFDHILVLYSSIVEEVEFIEYLLKQYVKKIEKLENLLKKGTIPERRNIYER